MASPEKRRTLEFAVETSARIARMIVDERSFIASVAIFRRN
jgi:hypothetical protein